MTGCWPFKKTPDARASSSAVNKKSPPKKDITRPYMNVAMAHALFEQNAFVGLCDIHLPSDWHLNARRVSVPPVPRRGR
jgi:hypothetical protein